MAASPAGNLPPTCVKLVPPQFKFKLSGRWTVLLGYLQNCWWGESLRLERGEVCFCILPTDRMQINVNFNWAGRMERGSRLERPGNNRTNGREIKERKETLTLDINYCFDGGVVRKITGSLPSSFLAHSMVMEFLPTFHFKGKTYALLQNTSLDLYWS